MISHKELRQVLAYDPETGLLTWAIQKSGVRFGRMAGSIRLDGYSAVRVNKTRYLAHRLIWFWMTGRWPENEIDHRDRNPANNRWINLREATSQQNKVNSKSYSRHGIKGICFTPRLKTKPWSAHIRRNRQQVNLGYFATKEEAHQAYCEAAKSLHGAFHAP
jgi:hypothetical protein